MTLNSRYTLNLGTDYAQALRVFIIQSLQTRHASAYYQIVQLTCARIAEKIRRKDAGDGLKLKLTAEQALSLQVLVATNDWPGTAIDNVLYHVQSNLPEITPKLLTAPAAVLWE